MAAVAPGARSISVLIPTLGREQVLIDTVSALARQTRRPDEIVVVDQNQPELPAVTRFMSGVPGLKHIRGAPPGVVANYNRCLAQATSDIVLFLDDDVIPEPHLIERHLANYDSPAVVAVAGRVREEGTAPGPGETGRYHRWSGRVIAHFDSLEAGRVQLVQGCNMSFRRAQLHEIGGMDEGFIGNGYFFETDVALRIQGHHDSSQIRFDPDAALFHLRAPAGGARLPDKAAHTYYFVRNGLRLYRRHSPRLGRPYFIVKMALYVLAKAIFNQDPEILRRGVSAITDGLSQSDQVVTVPLQNRD